MSKTAVIFGNRGALGSKIEAALRAKGWTCYGVSPRAAASAQQVARVDDLPKNLGINAVIDCAGVFELNAKEMDRDQLDRMWRGNVLPAFDAAKLASTSKADALVLCSAQASLDCNIAYATAYGASKAAVNSLAMSFHQNHPKTRTHCLLLTMMDTERNRRDVPGADYSSWLSPHTVTAKVLELCTTPTTTASVFVRF
ncbi:hypothetical protein BASA81_001381 [Batrachochytrium salamandrivorans]|nr:hypothetical protein BASA81_001381 [Batrachochytrium salamandrivorans]